MCVARAANISSSSHVIGIGSSVGVSSSSRMRSARGVPPGSRVTTTSSPRACQRVAQRGDLRRLADALAAFDGDELAAIHRRRNFPQIPLHGEVVLGERLREVVAAVARARRDEE